VAPTRPLVVYSVGERVCASECMSGASAPAYTGEVVPDRTIRVWSDLDIRLLMADLHAKLTLSPR